MITNISIYDNPAYRSFTWSEVTTGELNGVAVSSAPNTGSATPGTLVDDTYTRTDLTTLPTEIATLAGACWTEDSYTQHEAFLRAQ